jgi:hypothetical protein
MIKNLVTFGCSWPYGAELEDPTLRAQGAHPEHPLNVIYRATHSYPGLIASHFGWTLEDRTKLVTNLLEMLADFHAWLDIVSHEDLAETLVLVNLTREDIPGSIQHLPATLSEKILKDKDTNVEHQIFEWVVTEFDNAAEEFGVNLLQFNVLAKQHRIKLPTLIESSSALEMLVIRDKPRKDPLFTEYKHPNEKGHKIISEFLIEKINSAIIQE